MNFLTGPGQIPQLGDEKSGQGLIISGRQVQMQGLI